MLRWSSSWDMTTFSNSLEKKNRFETGLKFLFLFLSFGSSEGCCFFRRGLTIACLNTVRNLPESSDLFTTWVSAGTISSEQSNKGDVGIGSRSHVLQAIFFKRAETAASFTALKCVSGFPEKKLINKTRGSSARATVNNTTAVAIAHTDADTETLEWARFGLVVTKRV